MFPTPSAVLQHCLQPDPGGRGEWRGLVTDAPTPGTGRVAVTARLVALSPAEK